MRTRLIIVAAALITALTAGAAEKPSIEFTQVSCIRGGELALMQMAVTGKGELRAYFRRTNTTDWCSVEGVNDGPLSRIVLPKFENGDEIEYFFVLLNGKQVIARTPRIFRAVANTQCDTAFARHVDHLALICGEDGTGVPASMGAGYAVSLEEPCVASPKSPDDKGCGTNAQTGQQ
jgi:hypothetical protein